MVNKPSPKQSNLSSRQLVLLAIASVVTQFAIIPLATKAGNDYANVDCQTGSGAQTLSLGVVFVAIIAAVVVLVSAIKHRRPGLIAMAAIVLVINLAIGFYNWLLAYFCFTF